MHVSAPSPQYVLPVERHVQKLVHVFYTARAWVPPYAKLVLTGESVLVERDIRVWNSKTYRDKPVYLREDKLIVQHRKLDQTLLHCYVRADIDRFLLGGTVNSTRKGAKVLGRTIQLNGDSFLLLAKRR